MLIHMAEHVWPDVNYCFLTYLRVSHDYSRNVLNCISIRMFAVIYRYNKFNENGIIKFTCLFRINLAF